MSLHAATRGLFRHSSGPNAASASACRLLHRTFANKAEESKSEQDHASPSTGRTPPGEKQGAKPKILDETPPADPPEDVKQHNQEFEKRHDRAAGKINPDGKDNVGKGFWSGKF